MASLNKCDNPGCNSHEGAWRTYDWLTYDRPTGVGMTGRWSSRTLFCSWACLLAEIERDYQRWVKTDD